MIRIDRDSTASLRATVAALAAAAALSGCAGLPLYTFKPGEPSAEVNLTGIPSPSFCVAGTAYRFAADKKTQRAPIPVGQRVAVRSFVYLSGYQQYWTCNAGMSFIPEAGRGYLVNLEMRNQACRLEVYREGAANRIGLDLEPTFNRPSC